MGMHSNVLRELLLHPTLDVMHIGKYLGADKRLARLLEGLNMESEGSRVGLWAVNML